MSSSSHPMVSTWAALGHLVCQTSALVTVVLVVIGTLKTWLADDPGETTESGQAPKVTAQKDSGQEPPTDYSLVPGKPTAATAPGRLSMKRLSTNNISTLNIQPLLPKEGIMSHEEVWEATTGLLRKDKGHLSSPSLTAVSDESSQDDPPERDQQTVTMELAGTATLSLDEGIEVSSEDNDETVHSIVLEEKEPIAPEISSNHADDESSLLTQDPLSNSEVLSQQLFEDFLCYQAMINSANPNEVLSSPSTPALTTQTYATLIVAPLPPEKDTQSRKRDANIIADICVSESLPPVTRNTQQLVPVSLGPKQSSIELCDTLLYTIPLDWIHPNSHLSKVSIIHCQLQYLPETLSDLPSLAHLCISHNNLSFLPKTFSKLRNLLSLDISFNKIKTIEMNQLQVLNVSHNQLSGLPLSLGGIWRSLKTFNFDANPLDYLFTELLKGVSPSLNNYEPAYHDQGFKIPRKGTLSSSVSVNSPGNVELLFFLRDAYNLMYPDLKHSKASKISAYLSRRTDDILAQGPKDTIKILDKRKKLIKELIVTEETYVHQLELLTDIYLRPLRTLAILNPTHFSHLFSNIEEIMHLHRNYILPLLSRTHPDRIGATLLQILPHLAIYEDFCGRFDLGTKVLDAADSLSSKSLLGKMPSSGVSMTRATAKRFLHFINLAKSHPQHTQLNLQGFLILPIQRLPRYKMLLAQIAESTPLEHSDFENCLKAEMETEDLILTCNECKRRHDSDHQKVLSLLVGHQRHLERLSFAKKFIKSVPGRLLSVIELQSKPAVSECLQRHSNQRKDKLMQSYLLNLQKTSFGDSALGGKYFPEYDGSGRGLLVEGKTVQFFVFQDLVCLCKRRADSFGKYQILATLDLDSIDSDLEVVSRGDVFGIADSMICRLCARDVVLYFEAKSLEWAPMLT